MRKVSKPVRSLLDVNFLVALLDPKHAFHKRAHAWWADESGPGWASCPITENGFVRIMSNPKYDPHYKFAIDELAIQLRQFAAKTDHQFWPDEISLLDDSRFRYESLHGPRQITDVYLLALAAHNNGRLVSFDERIASSAVPSATKTNLHII